MDLSQQELPLTAYFSKGTSQKRKNTAGERSSKRAKAGDAQSTPSLLTRRAKPRVNATQLQTPATSTRKHGPSTGIRSVENVSPRPPVHRKPCEIDLTLSDSGETLTEAPRQARKDGEVISVLHPLATPSSNEVTRNEVVDANRRLLQTSHTCLPTPSTTVRKLTAPKPTHPSLEDSPTAVRLRPSKLNIASAVSHTRPVPFDKPVSHHSTTINNLDKSKLCDDDNPFALPVNKQPPVPHENWTQRAPLKLIATKSNSDVCTSFQMVPSSQSQYLLPLEATPTRNRIIRHDDIVPGSQTQEEGEIFIGMAPYSLHKSSAKESIRRQSLTTDDSDPAYRLTALTVQTPQPQSASCSGSHEPNVAPRQDLSKSPLHKSPTRYKRGSQSRARAHSPSSHTLSREDSMDVPPVLGDESATEPESDTEIQECLDAIRRRRAERAPIPSPSRSRASRLLISPLISPVRRRYTPEPSISGSLEALMQDGAGMSIPGINTSSFDRRSLGRRSASFPSVVRDFMDMFTGDGSYPDDFPESLRI